MKNCCKENSIVSTTELKFVAEMFVQLKGRDRILVMTIPAHEERYLLSLTHHIEGFITHLVGEDHIAFIESHIKSDIHDVQHDDEKIVRPDQKKLLNATKATWYEVKSEELPKAISDWFKVLAENRIQYDRQRESQT